MSDGLQFWEESIRWAQRFVVGDGQCFPTMIVDAQFGEMTFGEQIELGLRGPYRTQPRTAERLNAIRNNDPL